MARMYAVETRVAADEEKDGIARDLADDEGEITVDERGLQELKRLQSPRA